MDSEGKAMCTTMDENKGELEYGCFFCRIGCESQVVQEIERLFPMSSALIPSKLRTRRIAGKLHEEKVTLFPGYVFARISSDQRMNELPRSRFMMRLLTDSEGDWRLKGSDRVFAEGLFRSNGVFGFSRAYYDVNDRIHVTEGPLADYNGQILCVNRRKQTAQVQMCFHGIDMKAWLGFELMEPVASGK